ncbi:MAG: diacylglycerol kinase family protein [Pseudomonadota bacterium]
MTQSPVFVINPKSHKVNIQGSILTQIAVDYGDIPIVNFDGRTPLDDALTPLLQQGRDTIYVEGGDGTVLAALTTCFANRSSGTPLPRLAILPGGSTNLAHQVFGLKQVDAAALKQRLDQRHQGNLRPELTAHKALLIETSETKTPFVGFLLSTGSLARLMLYTQENLHGKTRGWVSIARAIFQLALFPRSTKYADGQPLIRPSPFTRIDTDSSEQTSEKTFTILSTFRELSLGLSPFWGRDDAAIGFTHAAWPIRRLRLGIAKAVLGGAPKSLERHGLISEGCSELVFRTEGPVILDGEELPMPKDKTFKVSVSPDLEFIR